MDQRKKSKVLTLRIDESDFKFVLLYAKSKEWTVAHAARFLLNRGICMMSPSSPSDQEVPE